MCQILKGELKSPIKFKKKISIYINNLIKEIKDKYVINFNNEELSELLLSTCRVNDFNVINLSDNKMFLDKNKVLDWIKKRLLPSTVIVKLDDEDIIRLLIFCIEITYRMFAGGTRATVTQKGFRQRRRTFESILADQFVGKLGEIMVKKYLESNFSTKILLDWEISTQIESYRNDIINAKKNISIKSSPSLTGIWAEADIGYDYGIAVKCSVPQPIILQFFIEVCGFSRLLDFAENKIPTNNGIFSCYLKQMRKRIKNYKCGVIQTDLKGFICGYFNTSKYSPVKVGVSLEYLGEVREERYMIPINKLKYTKDKWKDFLCETGLL
ncbi:unnamed protein product [marine sediment metagenome]|uniref:Uncharacterized protein n=2 Tax=marine sediment metagenome TaxID=412755 RepID=X0YXB1_9ZZZZ